MKCVLYVSFNKQRSYGDERQVRGTREAQLEPVLENLDLDVTMELPLTRRWAIDKWGCKKTNDMNVSLGSSNG